MNEYMVRLRHSMMLGTPDQPIVKLQEGQLIKVESLTWSGPHTLGYRFAGLYIVNAQSYLIEFNQTEVEFVAEKPPIL